MKKILRVVAITSTVMVVILGAFLWNMNRLSKQKAAKQEKLLAQERDLLPDSRQKAIDKVEKVNIKQLYLSGDNKNVVTVPSTGLKQVYDGSQSTKAEEMLTTGRDTVVIRYLWMIVILRILHVHHLMAAQKILRRNMNIRSSVCFRDV